MSIARDSDDHFYYWYTQVMEIEATDVMALDSPERRCDQGERADRALGKCIEGDKRDPSLRDADFLQLFSLDFVRNQVGCGLPNWNKSAACSASDQVERLMETTENLVHFWTETDIYEMSGCLGTCSTTQYKEICSELSFA